ncbi:membrane metalloprotease [uncultured Algibacter sp.]|uniref:membrane metalloprotease n=1 Tax=uncultured Algibacter sp. TaxID=298659 RepID=UPI0026193B06|nr:membrane metalloprotease [uncultured Algibacter sp.]
MKNKVLIFLLLLIFIYSCSKDTVNEEETVNILDNRQSTGSSANDILSDDLFTSIVIELVYVQGFEPSQNTINNFVSFLQARTFKPNGITVEKREVPSPGVEIYSIDDIADIEREQRTKYNKGSQLAIWAYFSDGKSENDSEQDNTVVLGTAYWNTSFVIYEETIQGLSNSPFEPDRTLLETTVINHEFGHILGLTDLGSPMQTEHEDETHENHCNVDSCLMYWASEFGIGINNMSSIPQLDSQCIADLQANGGR